MVYKITTVLIPECIGTRQPLFCFIERRKPGLKNVRADSLMHEFLKEYGPFIIAAVAILFLVALISSPTIQDLVKNGFTSILNNLFNKTGVTVTGP